MGGGIDDGGFGDGTGLDGDVGDDGGGITTDGGLFGDEIGSSAEGSAGISAGAVQAAAKAGKSYGGIPAGQLQATFPGLFPDPSEFGPPAPPGSGVTGSGLSGGTPAAPDGAEVTGPTFSELETGKDQPKPDLFNKYFDPNKFYGPPDPLNEAAVNRAASGMLTNNRGLFGFRETLVDDPEDPDRVKAEIGVTATGFLSDVGETLIGLAIGGPIGAIIGTIGGRLINMVADPDYTADQALYDATNPFGIRDDIEDPDRFLDGFTGTAAGGYSSGGISDRDGPDLIGFSGGSPAASGGLSGLSPTPAGQSPVGDVLTPLAASGGFVPASTAAIHSAAPADTSFLPEIVMAGALIYELST